MPTFIIVGAQKSGTTTLHDLLGQVPQVWVSDPKELHFFDKHHGRGLSWYEEQFSPSPDQQAWGESTPFYLYKDRARRAMAEALPSASFIAVLREPVSRAYSHYWFARSKNAEEIETFAEAIEAEPLRLRAKRDGQPAKGSYLDRGRYHRQLVDLADRVGKERILVHLTDDLRDDPIGVLRRTCRFLGVDEEGVGVVQVRERNTFGNRTVNSERAGDTAAERRLDVVSGDGYPPMNPDLEGELRVRFRDDNTLLAEWLGRDLSSWM